MQEAEIRSRLRSLGVDEHERVGIDPRDGIVIVRLRDQRIAFVASTEAGRGRLIRERAVLDALHGRVSFGVPEVLRVSDDGAADLRRIVPGTILAPADLFAGIAREPERSRSLGRGIGRLVAELHQTVDPDELAGLLPERVDWPEPTPWILERIPDVVDDPGLHRAIAEVLAVFDAFIPSPSDRVLVHGDVGLHNLALDPDTWAIHGIFDFGGSALADRHWDLRHLVWDQDGLATLDHSIAAYADATGIAFDRDRALLYNAVTAFSYLAFRHGVAADVRWCGRTLAEDLRWTRNVLARLRPS